MHIRFRPPIVLHGYIFPPLQYGRKNKMDVVITYVTPVSILI